MAGKDAPATAGRTGWASLKDLTRYQWFVFSVAALAWMADCMDQQLFTLARFQAMAELTAGTDYDAKVCATIATSVFLVGWAIGGIWFGIIGDKLGRVKTLTYTILLYSIFTGVSALSMSVWDFCLYRFLTGLGVGGVFAAAVSLIAETVPSQARPYSLVLMQGLSAVGNCTAAALFVLLGLMALEGMMPKDVAAWRIMFLIGLVPALLVILVQRRLREPDAWLAARAAHETDPAKKLGSIKELFGNPKLRKHALLGLLLAFAGVVGLWGIAFFSADLVQDVLAKTFRAEAAARGMNETETARYILGERTIWAGINSFLLNVGAFLGMMSFGFVATRVGRKPAFTAAFILAAASTAMVFWFLDSRSDILWMIPVMGFCQLAVFGGYAIYFPELFPTRLRATGVSFCYNVGRLVAATGPLMLGLLTSRVFSEANGYQHPDDWRYSGVVMCSVFLLGLIALPFLPETKGKPLPE